MHLNDQACRGLPSCHWAAPPSVPEINTTAGFSATVIAEVSATGVPLTGARDHLEAPGARDGLVELSGMLRTIATSL